MSDFDLEGDDVAIFTRFAKRAGASSLDGRRARETRPVAPSDRRRMTQGSTKSRQLNLKVTPEFHERVGALARIEGITMVDLVERAVEAFARAREVEAG
jgi:hypothetical protein